MAVDPRNWKPWGFDDYESVREITEQAFEAALKHLEVTGKRRRTNLREQFKGVATSYWKARRDIERPPPKWYRDQIKPFMKATKQLLKVIGKPCEGTSQAALIRLTLFRMKRSLRGSPVEPESIEQILQDFSRVCAECLRRRGSAGARPQSHVQSAVQELAAIWKAVDGHPLALSLDTATGHLGKEFTYRGPRFVQIVLQGIDPELSTSEIATALRKACGKRRAQKSAKH
jgi:hypothetical protein